MADIEPEHRCYEHLPLPICIVRRKQLSYANKAFGDYARIPREQLIGLDLPSVARRIMSDADLAWALPIVDAFVEGRGEAVANAWLNANGPAESLMSVRGAPGPRDDEWTYILTNARAEGEAGHFTSSLSLVAERLMRCRTELDVLETAVQGVYDLGMFAVMMLPDGDAYRHGPMRMPEESVKASELLYGKPMTEVAFPKSALPHFAEAFATRRSNYYPDFKEMCLKLHPPEVADIIRQMPDVRAVDAPVFVGDQPYGILSCSSPILSPAMAASLELFARQVGAAIENARHHKAAAEAMVELTRLQAQLVSRERLAALGEAAAVLAHEVRNPLAAMLNGIVILKRNPELPSSSRPVLEMVQEEAHHLDRIMQELLDFTRPLAPRRTRPDLGDAVQQIVRQMQDARECDGVTVKVEVQSPDTQLLADANLLHLALANLVRNAVQASPPGGTIKVKIERAEAQARVVVEDEGPGVPEADRERIFQPFFTTRARGTGLGLSVVQRVVQAHQGEVFVGSASGGGAQFAVALPRG